MTKKGTSVIKLFLKNMRTISYVLIVAWLFFSFVGAGFDASQFVYTFPILAIFFLIPVVVIEYKKNPVWVKARNELRTEQLNSDIPIQQSSNKIQNGQENLAGVEKKGVAYSRKRTGNMFYRIFGILFVALGVLFTLSGIIVMFVDYENKLWLLLSGGIAISVLGFLLCTGRIAVRSSYSEKRNPAGRTNVCCDSGYSKIKQNERKDAFIDGMDGHAFEHFCAELLRKNGFSEVAVTKGSGDQGVDVLAVKDGIKYAIQCKNYASPLSNKPVQEVNAGKAFYHCHVGVVMTNSTFTPGAKELAQATGTLLWDRTFLQGMMEMTSQK